MPTFLLLSGHGLTEVCPLLLVVKSSIVVHRDDLPFFLVVEGASEGLEPFESSLILVITHFAADLVTCYCVPVSRLATFRFLGCHTEFSGTFLEWGLRLIFLDLVLSLLNFFKN